MRGPTLVEAKQTADDRVFNTLAVFRILRYARTECCLQISSDLTNNLVCATSVVDWSTASWVFSWPLPATHDSGPLFTCLMAIS